MADVRRDANSLRPIRKSPKSAAGALTSGAEPEREPPFFLSAFRAPALF